MQYISASGKTLAAASLVLISPLVLLFAGPAAIGVSRHLYLPGAAPVSLVLPGAVALFALYKLHFPR